MMPAGIFMLMSFSMVAVDTERVEVMAGEVTGGATVKKLLSRLSFHLGELS